MLLYNLNKNGVALPYFAIITKIEGREVLPKPIINKTPLYKLKTSKIKNRYYNDRTIKLTIVIEHKGMADLRVKVRQLAAFFNTFDRVPYIFNDEPTIAWMGMANTSGMAKKAYSCSETTVELDCEPLSYDSSNQISSINSPFYNDGTEDISEWEINATLTADCPVGLKFQLTSQRYIFIETALSNGDTIKITSADRRLYINDSDLTQDIQQTTVDWFKIPLGTQSIITDPTCLTGTITYRRRYL